MVALSRCLPALAVVTSAAGARIAKRRHRERAPGATKFIAGVPVLNYEAAYAGEALGEATAEEEWVVIVKSGVTDEQISAMCRVASQGCKLAGNPSQGGVPFFEMRGTESDLEAVIKSGGGAIEYVEPDTVVSIIPDLEADEESELWGLQRVGAPKRSNEGAGVTVFLTDTGVRASHVDFGGRVVPALDMTLGGLLECNGDAGCADDIQGHGTHCAGTAAGTNYGVAPAATIRSVKVLSDQGSGSWSWRSGALNWMATSNIRPAVASMSLGGRGTQQAMVTAIESATKAGITVIVAGGNSNDNACRFSPAFVNAAITVGSTDSVDSRSSFSNYGPCTNIWAPGSAILSAGHRSDTATATFSGTSMACPHVAGGAMLVLSEHPSFTRNQVLEVLLANSQQDSLTDLKRGDTNSMLYVGSDAPPPPGGVTTPAPTPAPTCPSFSEGPRFHGHCECLSGTSCYKDDVLGQCDILGGVSKTFFKPDCSACVCK